MNDLEEMRFGIALGAEQMPNFVLEAALQCRGIVLRKVCKQHGPIFDHEQFKRSRYDRELEVCTPRRPYWAPQFKWNP